MMLGLDELATEIQSGIVISRVESKSNAGVAEMKVLSLWMKGEKDCCCHHFAAKYLG